MLKLFLLFLGEWEQALSRKDKKNRKKDDPLATDDAVPENIGNTDFYTQFQIYFRCKTAYAAPVRSSMFLYF
jgi:hypothetical protein